MRRRKRRACFIRGSRIGDPRNTLKDTKGSTGKSVALPRVWSAPAAHGALPALRLTIRERAIDSTIHCGLELNPCPCGVRGGVLILTWTVIQSQAAPFRLKRKESRLYTSGRSPRGGSMLEPRS